MIGPAKDVTEKYLQGLYENETTGNVDESVLDGLNKDLEIKVSNKERIGAIRKQEMDYDQRMDLINSSSYRNDIELFQFDEAGESFGIGGASVVDVSLCTDDGARLSWIVGGEKVVFNVVCEAKAHIKDPIVGFFVKEKEGKN